jgi:hypothetical protein
MQPAGSCAVHVYSYRWYPQTFMLPQQSVLPTSDPSPIFGDYKRVDWSVEGSYRDPDCGVAGPS